MSEKHHQEVILQRTICHLLKNYKPSEKNYGSSKDYKESCKNANRLADFLHGYISELIFFLDKREFPDAVENLIIELLATYFVTEDYPRFFEEHQWRFQQAIDVNLKNNPNLLDVNEPVEEEIL